MWLFFKFIFDDGEEEFDHRFALWIPSLVVYMPDRVSVTIRIRRNAVTGVISGSSAINAGGVERTFFSMTRSTWRKKHMCNV